MASKLSNLDAQYRHSLLSVASRFGLAALLGLVTFMLAMPSVPFASDKQSSMYAVFSDPVDNISFIQLGKSTTTEGSVEDFLTISLPNGTCFGNSLGQPLTFAYSGGGPSGLRIAGTLIPDGNQLVCYADVPVTTISIDLLLTSPVLYLTTGQSTRVRGSSFDPANMHTNQWDVPCCYPIGSGEVCMNGTCFSVNDWSGIYNVSNKTTAENSR